MSILRAENISRTFPGEKGPIRVLQDLDFTLQEGEVVVILGESGAGKSTLLHLLGTLDSPDSGRITIKGVDPRECSDRDLNRLRNRELGFVFQFHYLLPEFDALENVMMPAVLHGASKRTIEGKAVSLLTEVGLAERLTHRPAALSGGEQQRVAVARALMNEPAIVLADEPSGNLDDRNSEMLHSLLIDLSRSKNQAFVVVTHKRDLLGHADRGFELREGKLFPVAKE
ncbi:MAG: ABC transporter ATP-binding protein [Candidatus Krumholzibacteriota bacterium]|nr:ABC transporter ATP-binding protein [Candidatus Krumholzibacteriota bacterium]